MFEEQIHWHLFAPVLFAKEEGTRVLDMAKCKRNGLAIFVAQTGFW